MMNFSLTSIIIPTMNGLALLRSCIASIRKYTDPRRTPYEIIVADDGSDDGTSEWCMNERIPFVRLTGSAGFPAACNRGMRMAAGEQQLLLNNDTIVTRNWLLNLLTALYSSPEIGIVGPITNCASGRQQVSLPFSDLAEFQRLAAETNRSDSAKWEPALRIAGLCFLLKRTVYERAGELDERYAPGYYEDDDYCFRARRLGFGLRICRDTYIYHVGGASFNESRTGALEELLRRNRRIFMDKWNVDPEWYIDNKEESE
jgi:GT2 family glycosyltransferase